MAKLQTKGYVKLTTIEGSSELNYRNKVSIGQYQDHNMQGVSYYKVISLIYISHVCLQPPSFRLYIVISFSRTLYTFLLTYICTTNMGNIIIIIHLNSTASYLLIIVC